MIRIFITGPQGSGKMALAKSLSTRATTIVDEWQPGNSLHPDNYDVIICSQTRPTREELERQSFTFFDLGTKHYVRDI